MAPAIDLSLLNSTKTQLHRLTVASLKEVLKSVPLPVSGPKASLQERLESSMCYIQEPVANVAHLAHNDGDMLTTNDLSAGLDALYHKNDTQAFRKLKAQMFLRRYI